MPKSYVTYSPSTDSYYNKIYILWRRHAWSGG